MVVPLRNFFGCSGWEVHSARLVERRGMDLSAGVRDGRQWEEREEVSGGRRQGPGS